MRFNASAKEVKAFILLLILMIVVGFINGVPFVFGDAYGYFHVAKSSIDNGYYPSSQQPEYFEYTGHAVVESNEKYITPYSVGQTILYFPFLTASMLFSKGTVYTDYYKAFNGHSFADGMAILAAAMFFAYLGIIFCYLFLKQLGFAKKVSFYSSLAMFIGVYLTSYTFEQPGYSHIYEFFSYSAFLYFFIKFFFERSSKYLYIATIFAGLLVLIRLVDSVLLIPPFLFVLYKMRSKRLLLTTSFIVAIFGILLLLYNYISYGNPLTVGYSTNGQNGFNLGLNIINLLFSDTRGLIIWSPIVLFALIGIGLYARKSKIALVFFLVPAVLLIAVYNFWGNWWGGVSTGQRFLTVLTPIFALGIAFFYTQIRFKRLTKFMLLVLVLFSAITGILYRLTPVLRINSEFRNEEDALTTPVTEDYRLTDLYKYHISLIANKKNFSSYLNQLKDSFNGGRSIFLLALGQTDPLVRINQIEDLKYKIYFIPNNLNKDIKANLILSINYKDLYKSFLVSGVDMHKAASAFITCTNSLDCSSTEINLIPILADKSKENFARVSKNSKISVYGENVRVNYVNLKLK